MGALPEAKTPGELVCLDYIGPLLTSQGYAYICVMVCHLTRYLQALLTKDCNAESTIECINYWCEYNGSISRLFLSNAMAFKSIFMSQ